MPLPFKKVDPDLPDNRQAVFVELLMRDNNMLTQCLNSMQKSIDTGHIEPLSADTWKPINPKRLWYIPVFPVTQPNKKKVRVIYDSSASYKGNSLNRELLQGSNVNNALRSVLTRFRNGEVGFCADMEAIFYAFALLDDDKDFTRFFWWKDNYPNREVTEFRANFHVFGNKSSPALANVGFRYAVDVSDCSI